MEMMGQKYGRLTILENVGFRGTHRMLKCKCDCGKIITTYYNSLRTGNTQSCGCLHRESCTTHGLTKTQEYKSWRKMKERCLNENHVAFWAYGGAGVTICDRWLNSFENFLEDMGRAPSKTHSLDRFPNKNGNYGPDNCRWATKAEQVRNRNNSIIVDYQGEKVLLVELEDRFGVKRGIFAGRYLQGWDIDRILTQPVRKRRMLPLA